MTDHTKYDKFVVVEGALNFSRNQLVKSIVIISTWLPYFFSRNNSKLVFISYIYTLHTCIVCMCAFMIVSWMCCRYIIYGAVAIFLCVVG